MIRFPKPGEPNPWDFPPIPGKPKPNGGGWLDRIKDLIDIFKK